MKKILLGMACILAWASMQAQDLNELGKQYKQQVGIDATALIDRIFSISESTSFENPVYYLTYRKYGPKKKLPVWSGNGLGFRTSCRRPDQ
jgi:hypothetical protein